ncbi:MAG: hypothetical protein V4592_19485 [Bacteroidota bacterium]
MKKTVLFLIIGIITGCSGPKKEHSQDNYSIMDNDGSCLPDTKFVYKNLTNTFALDLYTKYLDNKLYTDSTRKTAFTALTPTQKLKLISPFISKLLDVNDKYAVDLMQAYFISKQPKIGEFQPIIVSISGDDYNSLTMIILDKNCHYIDAYNVNGGMQPGPNMIGDSTIKIELRSYSIIDKDNIQSIKIDETYSTDSIKKKPSIIDSTVFKTSVDRFGKFKTKQYSISHYEIPYK